MQQIFENSYIFRLLFEAPSDTASHVVYFSLADDHDLQTVSHCCFILNSCQWLLVTNTGSQIGFYRCHIPDWILLNSTKSLLRSVKNCKNNFRVKTVVQNVIVRPLFSLV